VLLSWLVTFPGGAQLRSIRSYRSGTNKDIANCQLPIGVVAMAPF